jgi:hypothetical protein
MEDGIFKEFEKEGSTNSLVQEIIRDILIPEVGDKDNNFLRMLFE